jgi:hypothetical protein
MDEQLKKVNLLMEEKIVSRVGVYQLKFWDFYKTNILSRPEDDIWSYVPRKIKENSEVMRQAINALDAFLKSTDHTLCVHCFNEKKDNEIVAVDHPEYFQTENTVTTFTLTDEERERKKGKLEGKKMSPNMVFVPKTKFLQQFKSFCESMMYTQPKFSVENYRQVFTKHQINYPVHRKDLKGTGEWPRNSHMGKAFKGEYLSGVDIVQTE